MSVRCAPAWILSSVFLFSSAPSPRAGPPVPPEITRAAVQGLPGFLSHIPPGEETDYGFASEDEARQAGLAPPFRLHAVTPAALQAWQPGEDASSLLSETDVWYFPITIDAAVRCILVVDRTSAGWEAVSLGYAPLAAALDGLMKDWPETEDLRPRLAVSFQAREYLFTVPGHPEPNLTPLRLATGSPGPRTAGATRALMDPASTVERLIPLVERNLAEYDPLEGGAP